MNETNYAEKRVTHLLKRLGISPNTNGFDYIRSAVLIVVNNKNVRMGRGVYSVLANEYKTAPQCVERSIRYSVEKSFLFGDFELLEKIFGYVMNADKGKVTNSQFIKGLADYIIHGV